MIEHRQIKGFPLKDCPLCGEVAHLLFDDGKLYYVKCQGGPTCGIVAVEDTAHAAIQKWNRRHYQSQIDYLMQVISEQGEKILAQGEVIASQVKQIDRIVKMSKADLYQELYQGNKPASPKPLPYGEVTWTQRMLAPAFVSMKP